MKHAVHAAALAVVLLGVSGVARAQDPYMNGAPVSIYANGKQVSTANPLPVTGGTGGGGSTTSPSVRTNDLSTANRDQSHDDTLAAAQAGTGLKVIQAGTTGTDYSANPATVPTGTPLVTIPVTPGRAFVEVQNQSAVNLQLVRDDGTGANQTTIIMAPATAAGGQGGGWSSATFKGRVRVFGAAGSQVSAYQD
jgi:hypothetical protein